MTLECDNCGHGMSDHRMILTMPASYECKDGCRCKSFVLKSEDGRLNNRSHLCNYCHMSERYPYVHTECVLIDILNELKELRKDVGKTYRFNCV